VDRRAFLTLATGGLLAAPLAAEGQTPGLMPRVGYVTSNPRTANVDAFEQRLRDLGYAIGQNLAVEYRSTISGRRFGATLAGQGSSTRPDTRQTGEGARYHSAKWLASPRKRVPWKLDGADESLTGAACRCGGMHH
jgi:hypothetical protein